jgi:hypothetical protein
VQAAAAEAIRDATFVAIALRQSDSVETRQAALAEAFEAAFCEHDSAALPAAGADSAPRKNWFLRIYDRRSGPASDRIPLPGPTPSTDPGLASSLGAALAPWKALLEAAWGGAWGGTTLLRSYQPFTA